MKHKKLNSLKFKVFFYSSCFSAIMLLLLWSFQTVFLNQFYRSVKTDKVEKLAESIQIAVEDDHLSQNKLIQFIGKKTKDTDYYVVVYDKNGMMIYQTLENRMVCSDFVSNPAKTNKLYKKTKDAKKGILDIDHCNIKKTNNTMMNNPVDKNMDYITYSDIYKSKNNEYFVIINSRASVINEVAKTISQQLAIVEGIMMVLSLILAAYAYRRISKPIEDLTQKAEKMGKGDFNIDFTENSFTEIETLGETLSYASNELARIDNLKNELIDNVSHDFKTPLTMISGYAQMMLDLPDEKNEENIKIIIEECNRLTMLVNDLLDLSKIKSNNSDIEIEEINISYLCEKVCERFNAMLSAEGYHVIFEKNNKRDIIVEADNNRITQVLYNIIGNAVHYTGDDKMVTVKQSVTKDNNVLIEIIDSGKGIKEEEIPYIWDRYYKSSKVTKRQSVGTGIGLSIVKGVLEQHNAKYGVKSELGKGSDFYFELPIKHIL